MSPDSMLSQLLAFPPHPAPQPPLPSRQYESGIRSLLKFVDGLSSTNLTAPVTGQDTLLDIIDPSINSIPFLYSLLAHGKAAQGIAPGTKLWDRMIRFVGTFDPVQMRYCGHHFRQLLDVIYHGCRDNVTAAVKPVSNALLRVDPSGSTLTSAHLVLLEICLRHGTYSLAFPILDKDVFHLPGPSGTEFNYPSTLCDANVTSANFMNVKNGFTKPLAYQDYLKYFLYGACIYITSKRWGRALSYLEIVLSAPVQGTTVSMIQVEAYKKWCLLSLLANGRTGRTPRNMVQFVSKHCNNIARAYSALGDTFAQKDTKKLQAEIEAGPFKTDCNYSLALLVLAAHYRFAISNLSRTYARLPLKFIPSLISRPETSSADTRIQIEELIASKQLQARLTTSQEPASEGEIILEFLTDKPNGLSENQLLAEQNEQKRKLLTLQERLVEARHRIEISKDYVVAAKKYRKLTSVSKDDQGSLDDDDIMADEL